MYIFIYLFYISFFFFAAFMHNIFRRRRSLCINVTGTHSYVHKFMTRFCVSFMSYHFILFYFIEFSIYTYILFHSCVLFSCDFLLKIFFTQRSSGVKNKTKVYVYILSIKRCTLYTYSHFHIFPFDANTIFKCMIYT